LTPTLLVAAHPHVLLDGLALPGSFAGIGRSGRAQLIEPPLAGK
jgi:hypothetical protein